MQQVDNDVVRALYYDALVKQADPDATGLLPHPFVMANHALERIDNPRNAFNQVPHPACLARTTPRAPLPRPRAMRPRLRTRATSSAVHARGNGC